MSRGIDDARDSGATSVSGWTVETLRAYLEAKIEANDVRYAQRFEAQNKALDAAMEATSKAVTKAEAASERRFEGVNEFRAAMADQQRTLMPRQESEALHKIHESRIDELKESITRQLAERAGISQGWGWAVGIIGLVSAVIALAAMWSKG